MTNPKKSGPKKRPMERYGFALIACLTLGLAPFSPPHVWEKLNMLVGGTLQKPMDIFDLLMHGAPWLLLIYYAGSDLFSRLRSSNEET